MARELSQAELSELLRGADKAQAKPQPVTPGVVGGQVLQALAAGVGAAALVGGLLAATGAPWEPLTQWSLTTGVIVAGFGLLMRAIPADRILSAQRLRMVQETVIAAEFRKRKAYEAIQTLEAQHAAAIADMQRALAELRHENKALRSQATIAQQQAQRSNWTPRSNVAPQVRQDAETILQHWFATLGAPDAAGNRRGEWWSRPKAVAAGWTKARHEEAAQLLRDAKLTGQTGLLPFVMPEVRDLATALHRLDAYWQQAQQEPVIPSSTQHYVEFE